jgi:mono/diheme cytochrome c family protein
MPRLFRLMILMLLPIPVMAEEAGEALYASACLRCHDAAAPFAEKVLEATESGTVIASTGQDLVTYLTGHKRTRASTAEAVAAYLAGLLTE